MKSWPLLKQELYILILVLFSDMADESAPSLTVFQKLAAPLQTEAWTKYTYLFSLPM